ncbi:MAG: hypothetical protein R3B06_24360 [Kofleriaceae bacterium]
MTDQLPLSREVTGACHRPVGVAAVSGVVAAAALTVTALMLAQLGSATRVVVVAAPAPDPVEAVAPPTPAAEPMPSAPAVVTATDAAPARVRCPVPRTDAPRLRPPALPEAVERVMVAPSNAGWVAAWNQDHIYVSTDAGAHFARVLDGPGAVADVGFDCLGTVIAVRGDQVGLRTGSAEVWRPIPGVRLSADDAPHAAIVSGGPEVVVVGLVPTESWAPRVARSSDGGRRWRFHDLDAAWENPVIVGRQYENRRIAFTLPSEDCRDAFQLEVTIGPHGVTTEVGDTWHYVGGRAWGDHLPADARWLDHDLVTTPAGAVARVRGERARTLPIVVEGDAAITDAAHRVWTIVCGRPWIARAQPSGYSCPDGGDTGSDVDADAAP